MTKEIYLKALIAQFHSWNLDFVAFCHLSDVCFSSQDFCLNVLLGFVARVHTDIYIYIYNVKSGTILESKLSLVSFIIDYVITLFVWMGLLPLEVA
jgi:hypothetical protein